MATRQPHGQARNGYGRDWGSFTTVATMPNGSGAVMADLTLEAGDHCYLSLSTGQCDYLCISPGTAGVGDAVWVPSSGQGPWSSVLYVDQVRGSDTTGQRGNANRPFATIQAAINAMSTDDTVQVAPQEFVITVSLTVPATVVRGSTYGFSLGARNIPTSPTSGGTRLRTTTVDIWNLGANLGLTQWTIGNLAMRASGGRVINADGSIYTVGTFLASSGLLFDNVFVASGAMNFKYVFSFSSIGGDFVSSTTTFTNCRTQVFSGTQGAQVILTLAHDGTDPLSPAGQPTATLSACARFGSTGTAIVTISGQSQIIVDETSTIGGLKGSTLSVSGAKVPGAAIHGYIGGGNSGAIDFATAGQELPDTATALTFDFSGSRLFGSGAGGAGKVTTAKFKVNTGGAATNFQTVKMDATTALPGCTFTADSKIHMTCRGATQPQAVYTTPGTITADGDIIPPTLSGVVDISGGGALAKTWVQLGYAGLIRTGAAADAAFLLESAAASDPFIGPAGKTTVGLTITSNAVAGDTACNWLAIWK